MAAKKVRKRAYIPPSHEVVNRREPEERTVRTTRAQSARPARGGRGGANYEYPQPSLRRTARRLPLYFVLIFALQYLLPSEAVKGDDVGTRVQAALIGAALVTVVFAPFMHVMDRFAYNRWLKRSGRTATPPSS